MGQLNDNWDWETAGAQDFYKDKQTLSSGRQQNKGFQKFDLTGPSSLARATLLQSYFQRLTVLSRKLTRTAFKCYNPIYAYNCRGERETGVEGSASKLLQPASIDIASQPPPLIQQAEMPSFQPRKGLTACNACGVHASKEALHETSSVQWMWCFCLFLFVPVACWVPFCMKKCDDIQYRCSNCGVVSTYKMASCCP